MWLEAFQRGTVSIRDIHHHVQFLETSRRSASVYLSEIEPHFPHGARSSLREAIEHYREATAAIKGLRDLQHDLQAGGTFDLKEGAEILSRALEHERAAVARLQKVLDASG